MEALDPTLAQLRIAIVGAGMGGLATALGLARKGFQDIAVYETAADLGFVGAGIQLAPNMARILSRWDCWDGIAAAATEVQQASIRDGPSGSELSHVDMPNIRTTYGFPHCTGHRASLAGGLFEACKQYPAIRFHFSTAFERIDQYGEPVLFTVSTRDRDNSDKNKTTRQVICDVLLAADGIKSCVRDQMLQDLGHHAAKVEDTGAAAYRLVIPRELMEGDPEMLQLLDSNQVTRWIGEKRHWIAYPVANRSLYNMSSSQPDTHFAAAPSATYTTRGSKQAMKEVYADFCPLVHRLMDFVPDGQVCEWKLRKHAPLPTWVHRHVALVGDACHPTLPHLNQGAAMAIEDGAVVAEVLARMPNIQSSSEDTINRCLRIYEFLRRRRTSTLVDLAAESGRTLHLGESAAKAERDRQFAEAHKTGRNPDKWASPDVQAMVYGHDCVKLAGDMFAGLF